MLHHHDYESPDAFDLISDDLILLIFNQISDIKTLTHCKSVSKRFNSLAPLAENLLVKVDCVISPETTDSILLHVLKSLLVSLQDLISPKRNPIETESLSSPSQILRGFEKIKRLEIELPRGDLRLEKGVVVRWRGEFGKSLKSCVILAIREMDDGDQDEDHLNNVDHGLKLRVVWTISALIAASTRHYLLREVIREHEEMQNLVLRDREGEGTLVMDEKGLREFREGENDGEAYVSTVGWKNRTTVPAVRMRMRHVPRLVLSSGVQIRGATLVIVRPMGGSMMDAQDKMGDLGVGPGMFRGVYGEIADELIKKPSYLLEMNSF